MILEGGCPSENNPSSRVRIRGGNSSGAEHMHCMQEAYSQSSAAGGPWCTTKSYPQAQVEEELRWSYPKPHKQKQQIDLGFEVLTLTFITRVGFATCFILAILSFSFAEEGRERKTFSIQQYSDYFSVGVQSKSTKISGLFFRDSQSRQTDRSEEKDNAYSEHLFPLYTWERCKHKTKTEELPIQFYVLLLEIERRVS